MILSRDFVFQVDITQQVYETMKQEHLKVLSNYERGYVEDYFRYITELDVIDVADAVFDHRTIKDYVDGSSEYRISLAIVRGIVRQSTKLQKKLVGLISPKLVKYTLKFENPPVYNYLVNIEGLDQWLNENIRDFFKILGVKEELIREAGF